MIDRLVVLTGAPGTGKTAILEALPEVAHVPEPARVVLAQQRASGGPGTHDRDPARFVQLLLERAVAEHERAAQGTGLVLFDRGVPDCIAYATILGVPPAAAVAASTRYRYRTDVLLCEPWEEIYATDDERTMSFVDTIAFHAALVDAYERCGYALTPVPCLSVDERAAFVRRHLSRGGNAR